MRKKKEIVIEKTMKYKYKLRNLIAIFLYHLHAPNKILYWVTNLGKEDKIYHVKTRKGAKQMLYMFDIKCLRIIQIVKNSENKSKTGWVNFDDIASESCLVNNIEETEVLHILVKLVGKGFIIVKKPTAANNIQLKYYKLSAKCRARILIFIWCRNIAIPMVTAIIIAVILKNLG